MNSLWSNHESTECVIKDALSFYSFVSMIGISLCKTQRKCVINMFSNQDLHSLLVYIRHEAKSDGG